MKLNLFHLLLISSQWIGTIHLGVWEKRQDINILSINKHKRIQNFFLCVFFYEKRGIATFIVDTGKEMANEIPVSKRCHESQCCVKETSIQ